MWLSRATQPQPQPQPGEEARESGMQPKGEGWPQYGLLAESWSGLPSHCGASGANSCGKGLEAEGNTTVGPEG